MIGVGEKVYETTSSSSFPLRLSAEVGVAVARPIGKVTVESPTPLSELSTGGPYVIAVSHASEFDFPVTVKALGGYLDIAVTGQSTHLSSSRELVTHLTARFVGKDAFMPVSYEFVDGVKRPMRFNPADTAPMVAALRRGKSVMIAAHNPVVADINGHIKEPSPGYLAAYLASITGAKILPVGVDLLPTDQPIRHDATVRVGNVFTLERPVEIESLAPLSTRRDEEGHLSARSRCGLWMGSRLCARWGLLYFLLFETFKMTHIYTLSLNRLVLLGEALFLAFPKSLPEQL